MACAHGLAALNRQYPMVNTSSLRGWRLARRVKNCTTEVPGREWTPIKPTIYPYRDEFPPQMRSSATLSSRNVGPFSERRRMPSLVQDWLAERAGFEPAIQFPVYGISNAAPSATRPPLQTKPARPEGPMIIKGRRDTLPFFLLRILPSSGLNCLLPQASKKFLQQLLALLRQNAPHDLETMV